MTIEQHLTTMIGRGIECNRGFVELPATESEIASAAYRFERAFCVPMPLAYQRILRVANGLEFAGLHVWPTHRCGFVGISIADANQTLRLQHGYSRVYFGQSQQALFGYDIARDRYVAHQLNENYEQTFPDAEALLEHMLAAALDAEEVAL
jgi:hypothetical protein